MPATYDTARCNNLVERYQQRIFALALYLLGGDRDKAYALAASGFAEALRPSSPLESKETFLARAAAAVVEKCRTIKTIPSSDDADLAELPPQKRAPLRLVRTALLALPFETRAPLLLRDQLHLSYKGIAAALALSEADARAAVPRSRGELRKKIEEVLRHG